MRLRTFRHVFLLLPLAGLAGCASMTFKRGASPDAMAADERVCRQPGGDEAAYVECMRARGWYVIHSKPASDGAGTDAATTDPPGPGPALDKETGDNEVPFGTPPPTSTPTIAALPPATATAAPTTDPNPLALIEVSSWWKLGGNPSDLDRAIDACTTKLGPEHHPDSGATVVTTAMHGCLREAGWYSIGGSDLR